MALQAMGLKELRLASDCSGTEDRAKAEVSIDRCALSGPDLGELTLSFRLVNADAPFWAAIDDGDTFAILGSKVGLASARLRWPTAALSIARSRRLRPPAASWWCPCGMASPRKCGATSRPAC